MTTCGVCSTPWDETTVVRVALTAEEKDYVRAQTKRGVDTLFYCPPCWKLLQDPVQGIALMHSSMLLGLKAKGIPDALARQLADKMRTMLLNAKRKPKGSLTS